MKYSVPVKFIAILLTALTLVAAAACVTGIVLLGQENMYSGSFQQWKQLEQQGRMQNLASFVLDRYAAHQFSGLPQDVLSSSYPYGTEGDNQFSRWCDVTTGSWYYAILDGNGNILDDNDGVWVEYSQEYSMVCEYPQMVTDPGQNSYVFEDPSGMPVYAVQAYGPEYTVKISVAHNFLENYENIPMAQVQILFGLRYVAIAVLAFCLLLFAVCVVYLCCAAGKSAPDSPVVPRGLNRLPLDVYAAVGGLSCWGLIWLAWAIWVNWFIRSDYRNFGALVLVLAILFATALVVIGFCFAATAQGKVGLGFCWRHSLTGRFCRLIGKGLGLLGRSIRRLLGLIPLMWRWVLLGIAMGFFPLLFLYLASVGRSYWLTLLFLSVFLDALIILYGAYAFSTLLHGARRMAGGDLSKKISTRFLVGDFRLCAQELNTLADAATVAVRKQMKSERTKTELITNVSHDIKTPLTSIINYVDLLQKARDQEESAQYLEVLGRQSLRMKKLIEDLVDMSKATSGNMPVEITRIDGVEAVNQALGEFSDKLAAADLTPVFRQPEEAIIMLADGKLAWRVLSNLLSNIVKYALPGTRVYIDLMKLDKQVLLSLKNISREDLNHNAEELTERFVRGDDSRNTEGSGLGLHIAKSLMELQNGQLQLLVDGDLFKVTLLFPGE